ncbi:MAG: hypothetical protein ACRCW9_09795 [Cetobacterium sp.]
MSKLSFEQDLFFCLNLIKEKVEVKKITVDLENIEGINYYKICIYKPLTKKQLLSEGFIINSEIKNTKNFNSEIHAIVINYLRNNRRNYYKSFTRDI